MIHFVIGTKAQFIKMAPLMYVLEESNRPYHVLDLGQHAALTDTILHDFGVSPHIARVSARSTNVESYKQAVSWFARCGRLLLSQRRNLLERYFDNSNSVALIHGDTLSTLLGLYLGHRAGLRVALVEAGLSSRSLLNPFPEELIRRHVESRAELLFAPDEHSRDRLTSRRLRGAIYSTMYNTGRDALALVIQKHQLMSPAPDAGSYSVLTLHRLETLSRQNRLERVIRHVMRLSETIGPIRFFLHGPTQRALTRSGLLKVLEKHPAFTLMPLKPYPEFIRQIVHCRFLLSDGGSIQEEASYLNKPCLILRERTERLHGMHANACLASFDMMTDADFLKDRECIRETVHFDFELKASRYLLNIVSQDCEA
ncbi:MAG: UDP-N-acetylglucosamine 2-epimerase [Gammaproteobacteria bacterium]|nr:UDP-N-acetylglucosamine 2-epimerase [Gammaproteobacteria bacterium]